DGGLRRERRRVRRADRHRRPGHGARGGEELPERGGGDRTVVVPGAARRAVRRRGHPGGAARAPGPGGPPPPPGRPCGGAPARIAGYAVAGASWFASWGGAAWGGAGGSAVGAAPDFTGLALRRAAPLRYGENPHQRAALYVNPAAPPGVAQARQIGGKEMSYN